MDERNKKQIEIVRIVDSDVPANLSIKYGLTKIKGISFMLSNAICKILKFDENKKIKDMSDEEIEKLENFLENEDKSSIPNWLLNKRKSDDGIDKHIHSKNLEFDEIQVKRKLSKIKSYRGLRLKLRLTVRGQRTKSNFRRNKTIASIKSKSIKKKGGAN